MLVNLSYNSLEDFYPACAVAMLLKVIKDPTLAQHHNEVVRVCTIYHLYIDGSFQYGLELVTIASGHQLFITSHFFNPLHKFFCIVSGYYIHLQIPGCEGCRIFGTGCTIAADCHPHLRSHLPGFPIPAASLSHRHCKAANPQLS